MKIVVLDGYTLNPGDLSWDGLRSLGTCEMHERTPSAQVPERAHGAEVVLTNKTVITREQIFALETLRYIGVLATGTNVVDLQAAAERGVTVTNVPAYSTRSVAQLTFALLLELCHHVGHHARTTREGRWSRSADFCYWDYPLLELQGLTMGIVGPGRIGRAVAALAKGFGMKVLAYSPRAGKTPRFIERTDLETVFRRSDVVSLHCPLTPETENLVNEPRLALMKPGAFLLNTSRGPLVDEAALARALNEGRIAGAGLDVLASEPPNESNPLLSAKNCLVTPHVAWATGAARSRLMSIAVENVRAFMAGKPRNVVS